MVVEDRVQIEEQIHAISKKIEEYILSRQKQKIFDDIDIDLCDAMVVEWGKLAKYYENSIYDDGSEGHSPDLQMRISIVHEYLDSVQTLNSYRIRAIQSDNSEKEEELEELQDSLEYYMANIIKAALIQEGLM